MKNNLIYAVTIHVVQYWSTTNVIQLPPQNEGFH